MTKIEFKANLPYNHVGKYTKSIDSIMNINSKVTFVQYWVEKIIDNRIKYIKSFPKIEKGSERWSYAISKVVGNLCQQMSQICNYFPFYLDDPLVEQAFKNYFKKNLVFKVGQFRKNRLDKQGNLNITDDEKNVVRGIHYEYQLLLENLASLTNLADLGKKVEESFIKDSDRRDREAIEIIKKTPKNGKLGINQLLELEKKIENG